MRVAKRRRRAKRTKASIVIETAAKEIRRRKIEFEREASRILSEALGVPCTFKINRTPIARTPGERKAARMTKAEARAQMIDAFAPMTGVTPMPKGGDELPEFLKG